MNGKGQTTSNNIRSLFYVCHIFCTGIVVIDFTLSNLLNQHINYILISYYQKIENDNLYF